MGIEVKNLYKSYFSLSRGESIGLLVLVGLILLVTVIPFFDIKMRNGITFSYEPLNS